ncbi:S-adenosylmethionine sensor upstream of mTORC1-like isoform X1 [Clavelina lepadiformis]|uniref:S-adenosylmethionine sensor upstream of mTORC1-like isoform X1 n=2 Tax=Clavelina lepadiformis TaxID=159417 RepID=UPI004042821D
MQQGKAQTMAKKDQKDVHVDIIRKTHKNLRRKLANGDDFDQVWKSHCSDDRALNEYSVAMKQLATNAWSTDCDGRDRTEWCKEFSIDYYSHGKLQELLKKDKRRQTYYQKDQQSHFVRGPTPNTDSSFDAARISADVVVDKIKLLDVGSCYNPYSEMPEFETVALDLAPANQNVFKCDFLYVEIVEASNANAFLPNCKSTEHNSNVTFLPSNYFQVVVFSLLLSYIPCPHKRWLMCKKAYQVLAANGLLLIITPDSSHQNRHAALMVKWKTALENIGFQRIKYCKDRHMHFIAFRKVPNDFIWDKRKGGTDSLSMDVLNIPQDFQEMEASSVDEIENLRKSERD